mgnify:CR=1 FL=1
MRELQCAIAYYQCHAQQKLEGQRAKKLKKLGHTGCDVSENRFWFWADQEKKIDCIMDLYMYSLTFNTQEYEELTSQLFLYKIIT